MNERGKKLQILTLEISVSHLTNIYQDGLGSDLLSAHYSSKNTDCVCSLMRVMLLSLIV